MPIKKKKPPVHLENKSLADMALYYRITNWAELWDQWFLRIDKSGKPLYKTIKQFANVVKESPQQYDFLLWYLGPVTSQEDERNQKYSFADKPTDWKYKRDTGGWYSDDALKIISNKTRGAGDSLTALRSVGNDVGLNSVNRFEKLSQKLDEAFRGEFFSDDLDMKENLGRARAYIDLHKELQSLKKNAVELFALTHGINFNDLGGFGQLIAGIQLANTGIKGQTQSKAEECLSEIVKMTMIKARTYDLALPEAMQDVIETTVVKDEPEKKKQKPN